MFEIQRVTIMKHPEIQKTAPKQILPAPPEVPMIILSIPQKDHESRSRLPENITTPTSATRQDSTNEYKIRGAGKPLEMKRLSDLPAIQTDAIMASPVEISRQSSRWDQSGKSTPQAQMPVGPVTQVSGSLSDVENFMKAFSQYTESVVDSTTRQIRYDTLKLDEERQRSEHARWVRYCDSFPAIGEDQARNLKATERARNESQMQLNQAMQEREKAMNTIAKALFATSHSSRALDLTSTGPVAKESTGPSKEDLSLSEQITALKSDASRSRKRHEHELDDLRHEYLEKINVVDSKLVEQKTQLLGRIKNLTEVTTEQERKLSQESAQLRKLTEITTKQESIKEDLDKLAISKRENIKVEIESEVEKRCTSKCESLKTDIVGELQPKLAESIISGYQSRFDRLNDSVTARFTSQQEHLDNQFINLQSRTAQSIRAEFQPELENLKSTLSTSSSTTISLQTEMSQLTETVYSIEEFHRTMKIPIQNMKQDLRKVLSSQEAQESAVQKLSERLTDDISDLRDKVSGHLEMEARMDSNEKACKQLCEQMQVSSGRDEYHPSTSAVSENQAAILDQRLNRLNDDIRKLDSRLDAKEQAENDRDDAVSTEIGQLHEFSLQLEADIKRQSKDRAERDLLDGSEANQTSSLASLKQAIADVETLNQVHMGQADETQQQIKQLRSDQLSTLEDLQQIRAEIKTLNEGLASCPDKRLQIEQLQSDVSMLQNHAHQRSTQYDRHAAPHVNGVIAKDEYQPKIEALETKVDHFELQLTDKVKAMESTLSSHGSRFNNMTTEPLVMSVIHALQKLYPVHALVNQGQLRLETNNISQDLSSLAQKQQQADGDFKQQISDTKQEFASLIAKAEYQSKQEVINLKQELSNLSREQDQAKEKHNELLQTFETAREADEKRFAEIPGLVKASMRTGDEELEGRRKDANDSILELDRRVQKLEQKSDHLVTSPDAVAGGFTGERVKNIAISGKDLQTLTTRLGSLEEKFHGSQKLQMDIVDKITSDIERLQTGLDNVLKDVGEQQTSLTQMKGGVKEDRVDFYRAQTETHTKTKDLARDALSQAKKLDALEKKADAQAQDLLRDFEKLKHEFSEFKGTVGSSKQSIERDLGILKDSFKCSAEDQLRENQIRTRKLEARADAQYRELNNWMDDAVNEVRDISIRLEELEQAANGSSKGDHIPAEIGEKQGVTAQADNIGEIGSAESDRDSERVKPIAKRSRDMSWRDDSAERPPQKKKRRVRHDDDDDSDDDYSGHSSPIIPLETRRSARHSRNSSQQTDSPSSKRSARRGRPPKVIVD
ncbi:MAG: hypothetical protein Q9213_006585 [Squamulea squamosa]